MAVDMTHDKMDFPHGTGRDFTSIEVWSNARDRDDNRPPAVHLDVDPAEGESVYGDLTVAEARLLAAMLLRGAERVEAMKAGAK